MVSRVHIVLGKTPNGEKTREASVPSREYGGLSLYKLNLWLDQLFSGRNLRTVTPACHISLSRNSFSSLFNPSRYPSLLLASIER